MANDVSSALGVGPQFEYKGKIYRLSPWKYRLQADFESYMKDQAYQAVRAMKPYTTDPEYRELQLAVTRDVASGYYAWGGEAIQMALNALPHAQQLFWSCLKENHPDATIELVQGMFQEKMEEMMRKMSEANADPNLSSQAPAVST